LIDTTGTFCAVGQTGPVWFLAGTTLPNHFAKRRCTIPFGRSILFPILVSEFSYFEVPFIKTENDLISYVQKDVSNWSLLEATVDGFEIIGLNKYRIHYGPFNISLPEDNVWNVKAGTTQAASDGFWVFLAPLSIGTHSISFHGIEPNFDTRVTYLITIES
jgi:hypothetical protein